MPCPQRFHSLLKQHHQLDSSWSATWAYRRYFKSHTNSENCKHECSSFISFCYYQNKDTDCRAPVISLKNKRWNIFHVTLACLHFFGITTLYFIYKSSMIYWACFLCCFILCISFHNFKNAYNMFSLCQPSSLLTPTRHAPLLLNFMSSHLLCLEPAEHYVLPVCT